jgi:hypothetical protein
VQATSSRGARVRTNDIISAAITTDHVVTMPAANRTSKKNCRFTVANRLSNVPTSINECTLIAKQADQSYFLRERNGFHLFGTAP